MEIDLSKPIGVVDSLVPKTTTQSTSTTSIPYTTYNDTAKINMNNATSSIVPIFSLSSTIPSITQSITTKNPSSLHTTQSTSSILPQTTVCNKKLSSIKRFFNIYGLNFIHSLQNYTLQHNIKIQIQDKIIRLNNVHRLYLDFQQIVAVHHQALKVKLKLKTLFGKIIQ